MGHQLLASTVFLETNTFTYCGCQDWLLQLGTQCFIIIDVFKTITPWKVIQFKSE